jgi:signal transduction histidine kinase
MLEDILLYAKPIKLELACIELQTFITDFIHRIKAMEAEKALQFELPLIQTIHPVNQSALIVKADSDRLNQILLNIYRNAVDAAYEKTRISCHLQLNTEAHTVSTIINNQGDVIPEAVLARIGEPFFTTKSRGTGLGMGIVKRMIEAHGGHLRIQSSDAEGTDIIITLPAMADS